MISFAGLPCSTYIKFIPFLLPKIKVIKTREGDSQLNMSIKTFLLLKLDKNTVDCYIRDWYREDGNICLSYHWEIWGLGEEMMEWAVKSSFILRLEVVHGTFPVWAPLVYTKSEGSRVRDPIHFMKNRMTGFCKRETWIWGSLFWSFWFYIITTCYFNNKNILR